GEDLGVDLALLKEVDRINTDRIQSFLGKIKKALWIVKDKKIAVLGLAFKPETDDTRNAPSISLINKLNSQEALLQLYDPKAMENMKSIFPEDPPKIVYMQNPYEAVKEANALLLVTEWDEFKSLDLNRVKDLMANPIIIDGRNVYEPDEVRDLGFEYYSIGRK
ncbi:MAG: UDP binding domain-containing protein, partial [Candidatus Bathyarchaeia archaeon]